jgi:predicted RNA-binding Zn ribbon-like protein
VPIAMNTATLNRKPSRRRAPRFELMAGSVVCLDFINTLDDRFSSEPKELLKTYLDLARFAEDSGVLDDAQVDRLFARSEMSPEEAQHVLAAAIEMREAIFAVFAAIARRKPVPSAALATLNQFLQGAAQHAQLVPAPGSQPAAMKRTQANARFEWRFDALPGDFYDPLWPIARSAADLLTSDQLVNVHMCASKTCEWFFLDTSKNHRRRWCDMSKCGNRAKVQRFYQRNKKAN